MYESPINLTYSEPIYEEVTNHLNETIYQAVASVGVDVNREELIKALAYDRRQYEKGYADGKKEYAWLPVGLTQPKRADKYFVLVDCGGEYDIDILSFSKELGWYYYDDEKYEEVDWNDDVYFWMPTPEKPKYEKV